MRFLKPLAVAVALGAAVCIAPVASAQPSQSTTVIVINVDRLVATSDIGRDLSTKLNQIATEIQGELQPEASALEAEQQAIGTLAQGQTQEQLRANASINARVQALNTRAQAFRERQVTASRDMEYTRQLTLNDFNQQITPIVREVMEARGAGVILDAGSIQFVAPAFDATDDVVQRLNQRLRTINVTRRQAPPPQQPGAAPPANR
jgi:Skp family chaperone for outer membrane proteins